jgi:hypothetical protein
MKEGRMCVYPACTAYTTTTDTSGMHHLWSSRRVGPSLPGTSGGSLAGRGQGPRRRANTAERARSPVHDRASCMAGPAGQRDAATFQEKVLPNTFQLLDRPTWK